MLYEQVTEEYLPQILDWAVRKTNNRAEGEELTQEIFLQIFLSLSKSGEISNMEHFVRKVAYYCWCNYVRAKTKRQKQTMLSEALPAVSDFASDYMEKEEHGQMIAALRRRISNLSRLQREMMILHYLEGYTSSKIAEKLHTTESAVAWQLFHARQKTRRELENMEDHIAYTYRPGKLGIGYSGDPGPDPDTKRINESLIRQNLCLLCYGNGKTLDELAEQTGIPKPYLEFDLDWLVRREFVALQGKRYETAFPIMNRKHFQTIGKLYQSTRREYIDLIIDTLWGREKEIREIGFYGSHFPMERLMWSVLTLYTSFVSRRNPLMLTLKRRDSFPIRPDGGRYIVVAGDRSENQEELPDGITMPSYRGIYADKCTGVNTDFEDHYYWLGIYGFSAEEYLPDIVASKGTARQEALYDLYCSVARPNFSAASLSETDLELLAEAVSQGMIVKGPTGYKPNFLVLSREQLSLLQQNIFAPIMKRLIPKTKELADIIANRHKAQMPKINRCYIDYFTYMDLWDFGIYALKFAVDDGKLWLPTSPQDGIPLTLAVIR